MNDWHSDDDKLYLRFQTDKNIFIDTGRISFVCSLTSLTLSDLGSSWFLCCSDPSISIELLSHKELFGVSSFLGTSIVKE
jgi:hypothetical protein